MYSVRWCFTICALFMVGLASGGTVSKWDRIWESYGFKPRHSDNFGIILLQSNKLQDKGSLSRLDEVEPGFDFTDEEMKKLKIWPGGAIPYYIDDFSFDKVFRDRIRSSLDAINSLTGLNFLELHRPPGDDETRWVFFVNRQSLLSCIDHPLKDFTSEGVQKIVLGYDCLNGGYLAEVVLALVGVPPQHNAPDRDIFIKIENENIMPGKEHLFEKLHDNEWLFHDVIYDFASASHYDLHKYTVNGKATITPLKKKQETNDGKGFSYNDILKIKMIYNYISKKRIKSMSIPKCNKLFDVDTSRNNYKYESEDVVQPRKKPNKYLGSPDANLNQPSEESPEKKEENEHSNADKKSKKEEKGEIFQEITPENKKDNMENEDEKLDQPVENLDQPVENLDQPVENLDQPVENSDQPVENLDQPVENLDQPVEKLKDSFEVQQDNMSDENLQAQSDSKDDDLNDPQRLKFGKPASFGK